MSVRKVRNGEVIAGIAGVVLFVSLFLPWYSVEAASANGWESLAIVDVLLTLCAAFGLALLVLVAQQATPAMPLAIGGLGVWAGLLAIVLTLIRVIFPPEDGLTREWGLWLALAAAITLFVGCWRSIGDERFRQPDGSWSEPSHGELGAGVEVTPLRPPDPEGT
jgi:hypothetical protein